MWSLDYFRHSLRGRLELSLTVGAIAVLTLSFLGLHIVIRGALYANLDQQLALRMSAVAAYAAAHPGSESIAEFMPQYRTRAHQEFFQVWDSRGRTLARADSSAGRDLPRLDAVVGQQTYSDLFLPDGHHGRAVAEVFPLPADDARGTLIVVTAEETGTLERVENRIHALLLLGAVATIVAMLVITRHAVLHGLRPVDDLVDALERVDPDDPKAKLGGGPLPSELRPVAERFSMVLNRLLDALAREKRYARNVAHELRTPLAEIRLLADVGSRASEPGAVRAALGDVGAAAAEMEQTVESLLALTRYEAGLERPQPEPVDLCAEIMRSASLMKHHADQHDLKFEFDTPAEFWVHADSALIRRLLSNLVGNAIAHSPAGSVVRVALGADGKLQLSNPAPQLTASDMPRLGERFFRISAGNGGSHAGLGLSLAFAIAKVLGLRLELAKRDDDRMVAVVSGFKRLDQLPDLA
jgi:signal transduction histidine kinase